MTQPGGEGGNPANSDQGEGGGIATTLFTQQQLDHTAAQARRGALDGYFKTLGLDKAPTGDELKGIFAAADEHRKQKDGEKGDVERLTGELSSVKETAARVPALEAAKRRAELAGDAGLKSRYHKYVEGTTDEEIEASIKTVLADVPGGGSGSSDGDDSDDGDKDKAPPAKKGTGSLDPNPQQGGGGSGKPKTSMEAGRAAYEAKHGKKE